MTGLEPLRRPDAMAVITVEPVPDDSPAPFTLKPLTGSIPANAIPGVTMTLNLNPASFPAGTATVR